MGGGSNLFSNFCHVPSGENLQVPLQSACAEDLLVSLLVVGLSEQDVVTQRCILDPGLLGHVGNGTLPIPETEVGIESK